MSPSLEHIAITYLVIINVVTFLMYGIDKWKAKRSRWRVSEAMLIGMAIIGGSIGAWLGMKVWHHKTLHKKFKYGVPLILIIQVVLVFLCSCGTKKELLQNSQIVQSEVNEHSPSVFLVMYDAEVGKEPLQKAIKEYGCKVIYDYKNINGMALRKPDGKTLEETMQYFKKVKGVLTVEYDHVYHLTDPVRPRLEIQ